MSDHDQELAEAFRRMETDLDDLRRLAGLGMLALEANQDDLIAFTVTEVADKAAAVWKQYQDAFPGNRSPAA